ncbi:alpha/beta hydrolase [Ktedonobacter robiniae]|uniref:Serine esterase n=1 Tax=Ktedonobacter robiniae TaxID=2778365 RepID=A0ABQ3V1V6_9CHLR|nr:phospholipase [Ktedonobacter robiniae]GHO58772.1 serine esterase [Ktedonobacter robiniae]
MRDTQQTQASHNWGRLHAQPGRHIHSISSPGIHSLDIEKTGDCLLYVPHAYTPDYPAPLVVMLHGAGGNATGGRLPFQSHAEESGLLLLAPSSRSQSWDIITDGHYGPDVALIDKALEQIFSRYIIDPECIAVEGFSDGASYALSLGLINGDMFKHIIAFSPGFMKPTKYQGLPRVYISHGQRDPVLPIDYCSRRIVNQLRQAKYAVEYHEFPGGHHVPENIAREALSWFLLSGS